MIKAGLWLMKARSLHALPPGERGQGRKSSAPGALDLKPTQETGFQTWFINANFDFAWRTGLEWIAGCRKLGLTPASEESDVDALEAAGKLEGKKWKDILALPEEAGEDTKKPSDGKEGTLTEQDRAVQLVMPWFDDIAKIAKEGSPFEEALYEMRDEDFADAEHKLRVAMDTLVAVKKERAARARARGTRAGK